MITKEFRKGLGRFASYSFTYTYTSSYTGTSTQPRYGWGCLPDPGSEVIIATVCNARTGHR